MVTLSLSSNGLDVHKHDMPHVPVRHGACARHEVLASGTHHQPLINRPRARAPRVASNGKPRHARQAQPPFPHLARCQAHMRPFSSSSTNGEATLPPSRCDIISTSGAAHRVVTEDLQSTASGVGAAERTVRRRSGSAVSRHVLFLTSHCLGPSSRDLHLPLVIDSKSVTRQV